MPEPRDPVQAAIQTLLRTAAEHPDRIADLAAAVTDELTRSQNREWGTGDEIPLDVAHVHDPDTGVVWDRCTEGLTPADRIWQTAVQEHHILRGGVREGLPQDSPHDDADLSAQRRDRLTALQLGIDALVMVTNGRRNRALFSAALKALRTAAETELAGES